MKKCERPSVVLIYLARFLGGGKSCRFKVMIGRCYVVEPTIPIGSPIF